jgi:hypothetical protein
VIQRILVGLVVVIFASWALAQDLGDEPPLRLKKKTPPAVESKEGPKKEEPPRPAPAPEKKPSRPATEEPKEDPPDPEAADPNKEEQELLDHVDKNMRKSEDRLANRELNDATRQVQEDILKDLDALINRDQQNPQTQPNQQNEQDQQGVSASAERRKKQTSMGPGTSMKTGRRQRSGQTQIARNSSQRRPGRGSPSPGSGQKPQEPNGPAQAGNNPGGGGQSQSEPNKLSEVYKDIWGHLPETMRAEMNAYSREQFMDRYSELIKRYYTTIAEKGRKR